MQKSFVQGSTDKNNIVPVELISKGYGQIEIERMINHYEKGNYQEHIEKQQAEAAVHQHFEESLKLAQQQKVSVFKYILYKTKVYI